MSKILVIGPTISGKSTVAKMAADHLSTGYTDVSSLLIEEFGTINSLSREEILENKDKYRIRLFEFGLSKQKTHPTYFIDKALERGDVVAGIRPRIEFEAVKDLFDLVLWVSGRGQIKETDELKEGDADVVVDNSGSRENTKQQVVSVILSIDQ